MRRSKIFAAALVMGASLIGSLPAMAASYVWDFTNADSLVVASGHLTTDAAAYVDGNVTAISGKVFGTAITGLVNNPAAPNTATSPDGLWYYDNTLRFPAPYVTNPGLLFNVATSAPNPTAYNLFSDSASQYELWADVNGSYGTDTYGLFSVTAVPEPATWALLFLGFGAIGWMLRGRNREQAGAALA